MESRNRNARQLGAPLVTEVACLLSLGAAAFLAIALLTYHPEDPSLFAHSAKAAKNACGKIGAQFAALAIQGLGVAALLLPAALAFVGATLKRRESGSRLAGVLGGMAIAVLALTVFLSLQWKYWPLSGSLVLTGGVLGFWMAEILRAQFNPVGATLVAGLVFAIALAASTPISVVEVGGKVASVAWKLARWLGAYVILALGLVAMRFAQLAGAGMQRSLEGAIERLKKPRAKNVATVTETLAPVVPHTLIGDPEAPPTPMPDDVGNDEVEEDSDAIDVSALKAKAAVQRTRSPDIVFSQPDAPATPTPPAPSRAVQRAVLGALAGKRGEWKIPTLDFLRRSQRVESSVDKERLIQNSKILEQKFRDFDIDGEVTAVRPGPVITLYEFRPGPGVKVSRIAALADDLSMALSAQSVRILAPLPGKAVVGIEIPNESREKVLLREFLEHPDFKNPKHSIPVVMGKDIGGQPYFSDLARMPHILCAGQTGSGKSVFMNALICSLLYRFTPDELRMILVDPKFIEFRSYQDMPHLLLPVVDDPKQASTALKWAVKEMDRRYRLMALLGVRNLAGFNQKLDEMGVDVVRDLLFGEENQTESNATGSDWVEAFEMDEDGSPRVGKLPTIVVIIDELADLMMVAKKEVEISIARVAQKARAAGIHLVIATQRPSTDVITGLIKANLPSRASFQLASYVDSKTILDRAGAERLLGQGDMLFVPPGMSQLVRLQGAYVDDDEIGKITAYLRSQGKPVYRDEILVDEEEESAGGEDDGDSDALFQEGVDLVKRSGHASASYLQRHLKIGYNRAARMIETMESRGIVGPADGARPREVLVR